MLRNDGRRVDLLTSEEREEFRKRRREVFEPREGNEILGAASGQRTVPVEVQPLIELDHELAEKVGLSGYWPSVKTR
jgi:hypothetical protein